MNTAKTRRTATTAAAREWMKTEPGNDEADIALEAVLVSTGTVKRGEAIEEIWSDAPETLMLRVNGATIIEIDVESGNSMRGTSDE